MAISICKPVTDVEQKELSTHGDAYFPVACYEDNMELLNVPIHWHEEFEFIVVTAGDIITRIGADRIILPEGSAVFINSGCLHSVEKRKRHETSVLRSLVIHPKLIGGYEESVFWKHLIRPFIKNENLQYILLDGKNLWHTQVIQYMMDAWGAIAEEKDDYENEARYLISKAFRLLSNPDVSIRSVRAKNFGMYDRMKYILSYIEEHYMEDLNNLILMDLVSCSESVLLRNFKQIIGISPMQYVMNYRITVAASLLLSTNMKSYEIATKCGFNDFSYFTKVFRRQMGKTPGKYRNIMRNSST